MDNFALIDALSDYCDENNYLFIYGNDSWANILADPNSPQTKYLEYDYILIADFTANITMVNSMVQQIQYVGTMAFGQTIKPSLENTNPLDETPQQKFNARLKSLSQMLMIIIGQIACDNELETSGISLRYDLNKFDLSADFAACNITFIQ
jgi:hypothetical protein